MELHISPIFTFFSVALMVSQVAPQPEIYWTRMLPNIEMPNAVRISLSKPACHVDVHREDEIISSRKLTADVKVDPMTGVGVHTKKHSGGHSDVSVNALSGVGVSAGKAGKGADVKVDMGGVEVKAGKKKNVYVHVHPGLNPFDYRYPHRGETDAPARALFFLKKDMKPRKLMSLFFTKTTNAATFLPREVAKSLAFSSDKIKTILKEFSVEPETEEAKIIEETIKGCEEKGIEGEKKYCATSLESMIDYVKNTLGKNVKAMSTEAKNIVDMVQNYTITTIQKAGEENKVVVCHKQKYAYAVFYCHKTKDTSSYMVSLTSSDGSKSKAMAVCHKDTSAWNPKHLAFQVLNVKPGSTPVCHFLPEDHLVWVSN